MSGQAVLKSLPLLISAYATVTEKIPKPLRNITWLMTILGERDKYAISNMYNILLLSTVALVPV